jgi:hypothetical protein
VAINHAAHTVADLARAFPSSILCHQNSRDMGKCQSKWTAYRMETPDSRLLPAM